jgi:rhodanese-related sulfurtransferase
MKRFELPVYLALLLCLSLLLLIEGRRNAALLAEVPLAPKELYQKLAKSQARLQIVDVRTDREGYEDIHLPGAIPFPGCDAEKTPPEAMERILDSAPTIIVSEDGDAEVFRRCRARFTLARNLVGGVTAWSDEGLPEDSGEYVPPKAAGGGGCL